MGVEFQQITFAFNCQPLNNMYFVKYRIINKSSLNWDSTYITIANDIDIGYSHDDSYGCDSSRNLSFVYNYDNDDEGFYGTNPPVSGTGLLQSPLIFTGINSDTAKLPYDTLVGYKLIGMTSCMGIRNGSQICYGDPDNAVMAYDIMKGNDGCGNPMINWVTDAISKFRYNGDACRRIGWLDSVGGDRRYFQNSGPFQINSGDTQIMVVSQMVARDGGNNFQNVCALQSISDSALKYYYNDFRTCIPIGINPISNEVPDRFMLYQNYPNPFNPSTKIRFSIPHVGNGRDLSVQVIIYDVLGREISTLVNEELSSGIYEVDWDGTNYSSGVYYYRLESVETTQRVVFIETKKMLLIK